MKTAPVIFLTICCAAFTHAVVYAVPSGPSPQSAPSESAVAGDHPRNPGQGASSDSQSRHGKGPAQAGNQRHGSALNQPRERGNFTNPPKRLANNQAGPARGNSQEIRQLRIHTSDSAGSDRLLQSHTINRALPPAVVRRGGTSVDNVRHRGPNPAVIGGTMNLKIGNTGVITGTGMNRRR
jgi:hypothetical protein